MQIRFAWLMILLALLAGCSRTRYRAKADADAYALLHEKTAHAPWFLPSDFDVVPSPGSRLFDPTYIDDPLLPDPSPQLYAYSLPELPERDPSRFSPDRGGQPGRANSPLEEVALFTRLPRTKPTPSPPEIAFASHLETHRAPVHQAAFRWANQPAPTGQLPAPMEISPDPDAPQMGAYQSDDATALRLLPIPKQFWEAIPASCRTRMLEFESVRVEYRRTYGRDPDANELDQSQRLALEDIVDSAVLNSREYQSAKESLYDDALRLSLDRFDYDLKFSTGGNRTAANYSHARDAGITVNRLGIPTTVQGDKVLASSADLLARFANSVVLTFNGSSGFAADVGSDLLLDIEQTVFQRDVRFERLTQSERNVVYSARDFRRSRKTLFFDLTNAYYNLLKNYRSIEIQSQNYFSLVREFQQRAEESRRGFVPLFQVDQVEQTVLSGRRTLITQCNALAQALDNLKIRMGLPTETPINLDLTELEGLTLRDELAVTGDLIGRVRSRLDAERNAAEPSRVQLLSSGIGLMDRILEVYDQQRKLGMPTPDVGPLELQRFRMRVDAVRLEVEEDRRLLQAERDGAEPNVTIMLQRAHDLIDGLEQLHNEQLAYATKKLGSSSLEQELARAAELRRQVDLLDATVKGIFQSGQLDQLRLLVDRMATLLEQFESFARDLDALIGLARPPVPPEVALQENIDEASQLVQLIDEIRANIGGGLVPIEIDVDDAMLTGMVKRLDLITERSRVADSWRQIKIAADDLKSVLNLRAAQTVSTRADVNRAFDFTFDESLTSLSATLDLPFNRRAQRNLFRRRLINYQAALRSQTRLEDSIKLAIRNDLRSLDLDKERYAIDVAGAALAYEQVVTTELQLRLGVAGVFSRDFLDAQNAYTDRLSNVASGHIDYIVDRMQLFLDLELLDVDENGFWPELYDEHSQPEPYYQLPPEAMPAYGMLPHGLMFSKLMRRMEDVPVGVSMVHGPDEDLETIPAEPESSDIPTPPEPAPLVPLPPAIDAAMPPPPPVHILE